MLLCALASAATADDLTDAAQGLCDSVRSCALEQIAREDLSPEMREMMEPMLDNMCATMRAKVQEVPPGHPMYQPAVACMRSLESLTCEQMQDAQRANTRECERYDQLAKEAGEDPLKP